MILTLEQLPLAAPVCRKRSCGHCRYAVLTDLAGCPWSGGSQRDCPGRTDTADRPSRAAVAFWSMLAAISVLATAFVLR